MATARARMRCAWADPCVSFAARLPVQLRNSRAVRCLQPPACHPEELAPKAPPDDRRHPWGRCHQLFQYGIADRSTWWFPIFICGFFISLRRHHVHARRRRLQLSRTVNTSRGLGRVSLAVVLRSGVPRRGGVCMVSQRRGSHHSLASGYEVTSELAVLHPGHRGGSARVVWPWSS